jgi:hypothetical protein
MRIRAQKTRARIQAPGAPAETQLEVATDHGVDPELIELGSPRARAGGAPALRRLREAIEFAD